MTGLAFAATKCVFSGVCASATTIFGTRLRYAGCCPVNSKGRPLVRMSDNVSGVGGGRGPIHRSRLSEFSFAGGDHSVQDDLVREIMWRAAQVAVDDIINIKIAEFDAGISDILSELFDRREKDIIERNEQMALRAAHLDLARWNSKWREGQRESRKKRQEISAELAIVNKLLLSRQAKKAKKKRGKKARHEVVVAPSSSSGESTAQFGRHFVSPKSLLGDSPVFPTLLSIVLVTYFGIQGFESYVEAHDPQSLAKASLVSFVILALVGQSAALRKHIAQRQEDWNL